LRNLVQKRGRDEKPFTKVSLKIRVGLGKDVRAEGNREGPVEEKKSQPGLEKKKE